MLSTSFTLNTFSVFLNVHTFHPQLSEQMWTSSRIFNIHKNHNANCQWFNLLNKSVLSDLHVHSAAGSVGRMVICRQVFWEVAELQELSSCKHDLHARRRSAATESLLKVSQRCLPLLSDLVDPDLRLDVKHARKHEGKGLSVQRILFFYYYSFSLSFHYHPVGRRLSFCFGTHSLHTVGKSLN